jgi:hypothetical protein
MSASQPMVPQQHTAFLIQSITPTEVLISRLPHQNGVNWVFHDSVVGTVRHVNVPYAHPLAQQLVNQSASQPITTTGIMLYQQPSNQIAQHTPHIASANQPTVSASLQPVTAVQPMASASL